MSMLPAESTTTWAFWQKESTTFGLVEQPVARLAAMTDSKAAVSDVLMLVIISGSALA